MMTFLTGLGSALLKAIPSLIRTIGTAFVYHSGKKAAALKQMKKDKEDVLKANRARIASRASDESKRLRAKYDRRNR